jgi:hypothetical protein
MIVENFSSACSCFAKACCQGVVFLFDWQEGKGQGNPSQPPLVRGGADCVAEPVSPSSKRGGADCAAEPVSLRSSGGWMGRRNTLPPDKGGWGGCLLTSKGQTPSKILPNTPAAEFLASAFQPWCESFLSPNGLFPEVDSPIRPSSSLGRFPRRFLA